MIGMSISFILQYELILPRAFDAQTTACFRHAQFKQAIVASNKKATKNLHEELIHHPLLASNIKALVMETMGDRRASRPHSSSNEA